MSKQANPVVVGSFVIVAIALFVAALVILGSGKFFQNRPRYIMYFDGSVEGLRVGAPVNFRGVQIGEVAEIKLLVDHNNGSILIPVIVTFDPTRVQHSGERRYSQNEFLAQLIERGMRARLQSQSFVTGLYSIELNFRPDTPTRYVGSDEGLMEIPTVPSKLEEISKTIEDLPIKEVLGEARQAVEALTKVIDNDDARNFFGHANASLKDGQAAIEKMTAILEKIDTKVGPIGEDALQTVRSAKEVLSHIDEMVSTGSATRNDFRVLVGNLSKAAQSMADLAQYLERNPNALIYGKKELRGDR